MRIPFLLLCLVALISCSRPQTSEDEYGLEAEDTLSLDSLSSPAVEEPVVELDPIDTALDNAARYLAGLHQLDSNQYTKLEQEPAWQSYKRLIDANWERIDSMRLQPMAEWRERELAPRIADSLWLFYPFSGPDFLHAQTFYPHASGIIMVALEPVVQLPEMQALGPQGRQMVLDTLGRSLRDIFGKSYFITRHMMSDLSYMRGVLPVFCVFLKRCNQDLLDLQFLAVDSAGRETMVPFQDLRYSNTRGFRLTFRSAEGGKTRELYYVSADISNRGQSVRPGFRKFIQSHAPYNSFIKSASYLLHVSGFEDIRGMVVSTSRSLLQDDTGVPYKYVKRDFNGRFYGEYVRPIPDFSWLDKQRDLDSAYQADKQPLPFSLGYHWTTRQQNYMLFMRRN